MLKLNESRIGLLIVGGALTFTAVGVAANIAGFTDPESWFLTALTLGVLAAALAIDEHRLSNAAPAHVLEAWFARIAMVVAAAASMVGFILGLLDDDNRNLWSVMALILALIALSISVDSQRVAVAHRARISHEQTDAIGGVICAALAFGVGIFGLFTGLFGYPHGEAWLFSGVVFGVVATAFMFDEQNHVLHKARHARHKPFNGEVRQK